MKELRKQKIADIIGVHRGTITRELKRNASLSGWKPEQAHQKAKARRKNSSSNALRITQNEWAELVRLIQQKHSPEQVSGRLKAEQGIHISTEYIYQHIYRDKDNAGTLHKHLCCQKSKRKCYASGQERRGMIKNRISIDERPVRADEKARIGDLGGDTVIGKGHQGVITTLIERKSLYLLAAPVKSKRATGVRDALIELLTPYKAVCHTITFDNGKEFALHEQIAQALKTEIYFAHPYHSWERGCNENANGFLRQYFSKSCSLREVSLDEVQAAVDRLNHRPRNFFGL